MATIARNRPLSPSLRVGGRSTPKRTGLFKMARKGSVKYLNTARSNKSDEFYTILSDIERELKHYKKHFRNKVVLCNCDDPRVSNFLVYFSQNFGQLSLKKVVTTCYKNQNADLFSEHKSEKAIYLEYAGGKNPNSIPDPEEIGIQHLQGDGDFRSDECIALLKQADVIVTNPPFSLFREYVAQLVEYDKKFLTIGTWNAISYKEIFKLIKENKIWIGVNSNRNFSGFIVPKHYSLHGTEARIDEDGNRIVSSNNTCWFTNLDNKKRYEDLILYKNYNPKEFPKYDNYDAIEVSRTSDIPMDYEGAMGVPVTFLDKYNPEQFEILGITDRDNNSGLKTRTYTADDVPNPGDLNRRAVVKIGKTYKATFARLLVRKKR
jgi:Adenine-specific methyltransferase EcoRI